MFRTGPTLILGTATSVLNHGLRAIKAGETQIDLSELISVDSSAIAVLLAWQRAALKAGKQLNFINLPANLEGLANLYGVHNLLRSVSTTNSRADLPIH